MGCAVDSRLPACRHAQVSSDSDSEWSPLPAPATRFSRTAVVSVAGSKLLVGSSPQLFRYSDGSDSDWSGRVCEMPFPCLRAGVAVAGSHRAVMLESCKPLS